MSVARLAKAALVASSVTAFLVPEAYACWNVDGAFNLRQSNGYTVRCTLNQGNGQSAFDGNCTAGGNSGTVTGSLKSNGAFRMTVRWDGGARGRYTGFVNDDGDIEDGITYDMANRGSSATWSNLTTVSCE